jgi:diguanylate cyclase (GGDEF)-like protein
MGTFLGVSSLFILGRRERIMGIRLVGFLAAFNAIFLFTYGGFLLSDNPVTKIWMNHGQYLAIPFFSAIWFLLSIQQKKNLPRFRPKLYLLIMAIPVLAMIANLLYPATETTTGTWINHLLFSSHRQVLDPDFGSGFVGMVFTKAPFYYILMVYQAILSLFSTINYLTIFRKTEGLVRQRSLILSLVSFLGFGLSILTVISPETATIDCSPFVTGLFSFIIFILLFKYEMFELIPLAYRKIYQDSDVPIVIFDRSRKVVSINRAAKTFFKDIQPDLVGMRLDEFEAFDHGILSDLSQLKIHETKKTVKETEFYYQAQIMDIVKGRDRVTGYVLYYQDITAQKQELLRMQTFARYDDLTQICNRRYFFQLASKEFDEAIEKRQKITVIMFDLDDFKQVNDIYGHQAGDVILQEMAGLVAKELDPEALFSRYGGEEFIIFQRKQTIQDAAKTASRLCAMLVGHVFVHDKHPIRVSASFGVTGVPKQINQSLDNYIKEADDALYNAKNHGKKQVFVHSDII